MHTALEKNQNAQYDHEIRFNPAVVKLTYKRI